MSVLIDSMAETDWPSVRRIYEQGIATGEATFRIVVPEWQEWDESHLPFCRLVMRLDGEIQGWAALSPVSRRAVYRGVAEVSVYVSASSRGTGYGHRLLAALVDCSEQKGLWTLQASIFPENAASLAVHSKCGFTTVGIRKALGCLHGRWRDVALLERRSHLVGR